MDSEEDVNLMQMHVQSVILDLIDSMDDQDIPLGYVDSTDESLYVNAALIHGMLVKLKEQAMQSEDRKFRMASLMTMLSISETLKLAHLNLIGYDADSIAAGLDN